MSSRLHAKSLTKQTVSKRMVYLVVYNGFDGFVIRKVFVGSRCFSTLHVVQRLALFPHNVA